MINLILFSPPYAHESTSSKKTKWQMESDFNIGHTKETKYTDNNYRIKKHRGNIGKLKLFKRVPCSPEEADNHDTRPERKGTIWEYTKVIKV